MMDAETQQALQLVHTRVNQLLDVARLHGRQIVELREKVEKLEAACAVNADAIARGIVEQIRTLDEVSNQSAALQEDNE